MSKIEAPPTMFVFAGNNGSGKSTIRGLIVDKIGVQINIDPDMITRKFKYSEASQPEIKAGRKVVELVNKSINRKDDFSIETTLSGKSIMQRIKKAKENGYMVCMFYIGLNDVSLNIERVETRFKNGGHFIPKVDIMRREQTSIQNLISNLDLIDYLQVIDNSGNQGEVILEFENPNIIYSSLEIPLWAENLVRVLKKKNSN